MSVGRVTAAGAELSAAERRELLLTARRALAAHLRGGPAPSGREWGPACGAFVTLRRRADGELRGCVGQIATSEPLSATVAEMAVAAGTRDGRFEPVTAAELDSLQIDVSVLSPLAPIEPAEVEVGRHGLMVRHGERRGLLLPQVPVEQGWDRESFLAHTCEKAGLPRDTWRKPGVELLGFSATVFGEED